jgi:trimethylamine--corrinoid protein Co-methyltransferase
MVEGTLIFARAGLPVCFSPQVQAGATGPVTLAGTLVQHNAEVLSGVAIAQAASPGVPVIYGCVTSVSDMRTGAFAYGAVEGPMLNVASTQLARYYHLPSRATSGFTDSKILDYQCAMESMMTNLMVSMSGVNYIQGAAGGLESSLTCSYEKMVIDNEALGMIARAMKGIDVNLESLAGDLIARIGPGGHYLAESHTRRNYRRELSLPGLMDRASYESWRLEGAKDLVQRAREKTRSILDSHKPLPIEPGLAREIDRFVAEVENRHK